MAIDYRDLLKKYMFVITTHEGIDYIHGGVEFPTIGIDYLVQFSEEEVEELKQISKETESIFKRNRVHLDEY